MSKDFLLALKVQIDRALADFGAGGYIIHGGPVEPALKELLPGRIQDFAAALSFFPRSSLCRAQNIPLPFLVEIEPSVIH
jgi:hypothetical protein